MLALAACYDVGRAINRNSVEGQMEGGAAMGLGYALLEEDRVVDGVTLTPNLMTYLIPTALDVPDVDDDRPGVRRRAWARGGPAASESPRWCPRRPPIANAVRDAVGVRMTRLPITPRAPVAGDAGRPARPDRGTPIARVRA